MTVRKFGTRREADTTVAPRFLVNNLGNESVELIAGKVRVPRLFRCTIEGAPPYDVNLGVHVDDYGQPNCWQLTVLGAPEGQPIDWKALRQLPLESWLSHGMTLALETWDEERQRWVAPGQRAPSQAREAVLQQLQRSVVDRAGSRRPINKEFLATVASIYLAGGEKPGVALQQAFPEHARSTINEWVRRARDAGLIPPAKYQRTTKKGGK